MTLKCTKCPTVSQKLEKIAKEAPLVSQAWLQEEEPDVAAVTGAGAVEGES